MIVVLRWNHTTTTTTAPGCVTSGRGRRNVTHRFVDGRFQAEDSGSNNLSERDRRRSAERAPLRAPCHYIHDSSIGSDPPLPLRGTLLPCMATIRAALITDAPCVSVTL
ncbi:hypothetical protein EYF80_056880 [Liparis tanakae]|uniref:Uncharacterized protein n=1 Tax=Liparis tanakae TaxID=230148 RepID=A0A4Z2EVQ4_9TELE|nr:hypothetical protein EYF80_056880 [Liparis tanakae]